MKTAVCWLGSLVIADCDCIFVALFCTSTYACILLYCSILSHNKFFPIHSECVLLG
jgi:hypothetical protein